MKDQLSTPQDDVFNDKGHPMPRRSTPEKSVTLQHHRIVRGASVRLNPSRPTSLRPASSRRNSSGDSHQTSQSDPKKWFDRSNRNPTTAFDPGAMDIDPPFYQKETDSSNEEFKREPVDNLQQYDVSGTRQIRILRPAVTHSSSADDYRSVIDDLTIENKRLKEELKRYRKFGSDLMRKEKLFEIKVHGLPRRKKRELESTLRNFAANLEGSSETTSNRRKPGKYGKETYYSGCSMSKIPSSSSSRSRPVDSAYASMSTGWSSAPKSSGTSLGRPSAGSRAKSSGLQNLDNRIEDTPDGLFPRSLELTEKEKQKLVVRRLEQLFTGKITGRVVNRNQSGSSLKALVEGGEHPGPVNLELAREAQIQPTNTTRKKTRSPQENISTSNSVDQTESGGHGESADGGCGGVRSANNTSSQMLAAPEQRPTRPHDVDPDRVQIPSENMDYMRHLGFGSYDNLAGEKISADADGWVYLNLLCNMAQLHMLNVTSGFIRTAVSQRSTKFQLSPDGRKLRWRGGRRGTKFSSDSSTSNSQKSPYTNDTDGSNESGQRKKQELNIGHGAHPPTNFGPKKLASFASIHYKPIFIHQSSSLETSLEGTSQSSSPLNESYLDTSNRYSASGSSRRKRRHDGAIIYYSGAPFCTDLSGDPGDKSPTTYMNSSSKDKLSTLDDYKPELRRTQSGSFLPVKPLSDDPGIVAEALDIDLDSPPELFTENDDGLSHEGSVFRWCDDLETLPPMPIQPPLEPCGLGGVVPEDHFAVIVTTRRPILSEKANVRYRARFTATTESVAGRPAVRLMLPPTSARDAGPDSLPVKIEYVSRRVQPLKPAALPLPAMFYPPFSTDSDEEYSDGDGIESECDDGSEEDRSHSLTSQRVNPHQSDNTCPDGQELNSNDAEGDINGDEGDGEGEFSTSSNSPVVLHTFPSRSVHRGSSGPSGREPRPGSSIATAGGAESGYSSSVEEDTD